MSVSCMCICMHVCMYDVVSLCMCLIHHKNYSRNAMADDERPIKSEYIHRL